MKKMLVIFSLLMFLPVLNAEENTYFDLPQVSVDELPIASSDTLDKVYIVDNKYYITDSQTSGSPTYLTLGTDYVNTKIYFNGSDLYDYISNNCPSANYVQWSTGTFSNEQFIYVKRGSCYNTLALTNMTYKTNTMSSETTTVSTSSIQFAQLGSNIYMEYFIPNSTFIISTIKLQNVYEMFSLTPFTSTTTYSWLEITEEQVYRVRPQKIYVPSNNLYCYHFVSDNILRGYTEQPTLNEVVEYYDFNLDYHYRQSTGFEEITDLPVCLANTTTNYLYREDILSILGYFTIFSFFVIFIPIKVFSKLFKRGGL